MERPKTKIAVTLYGLRDYCKTEEDLDKTLGKVRDIGFRSVQVSGLGDISTNRVKELLDKHDLYCCATHDSLVNYENNFSEVVEKLKTLNCNFTALGSPGITINSSADVTNLSIRLEKIGAKFAKEGVLFAYHNHHSEFVKYSDLTMLEQIYNETTDNLYAELDLHWIQRGGGDPCYWLEKMGGRTSVVHFKDVGMKYIENHEPIPFFCEIGEGNLNWKGIIKSCEKTNVDWYVVEQDEPNGERDIFESIKISFNNMKKMGIK